MLVLWRNLGQVYRWLLAALAETAAVIPWMILLYSGMGVREWPEGLPGAWLLLLVYLAAAAWERRVPPSGEQAGQRRLLPMLVGMVGAYLLAHLSLPLHLRPDSLLGANLALAFVPVAGFLWYQGAKLGAEGLMHAGVYQRFIRQCAILMLGILGLVLTGGHRHPGAQLLLLWSIPLQALAGLSLLAITREQAMRSDQAREGETDAGGGSLSRMTSGVVLALLAVTLLVSYLLSVDRLAAAAAVTGGWIAAVWTWAVDVVMLIAYRWALLLSPVVTFLRGLLVWGRGMPGADAEQQGQQPEQPALEVPEQELVDTAALMPYVRAALLLAVIVTLAVWLYRIRLSRNEQAGEDEEERISLGFWPNLLADLRALLGLAGHKAARIAREAKQGGSPERLDSRDPRALFRRLQTWGRQIGRSRHPAETPNRYREALAGVRPGAEGEIGVITDVYNQHRYGTSPPSPGQVERAVRAMEALSERQRREE